MKMYNKLQRLMEPSTNLNISSEIARSIGLSNGGTLHGFILDKTNAKEHPKNNEKDYLVNPFASIILSPFPVSSWGNLLRFSITVPPRQNMLHLVQKALNNMFIYCRHIESTNGLDLSKINIHIRKTALNTNLDSKICDGLIIPSTLMCIEIPCNVDYVLQNCSQNYCCIHTKNKEKDCGVDKFISDLKTISSYSSNLHQVDLALKEIYSKTEKLCPTCLRVTMLLVVHSLLRAVINGNFLMKETMTALQKELKLKMNELYQIKSKNNDVIEPVIDWISPMATLNRLGSSHFFDQDPQRARDLRAIARKKFQIEKIDKELTVNVQTWHSILWDPHGKIPDKEDLSKRENLLLVGHADSAEKLVCWDVFRQNSFLIVELSMLTPLNGLEHLWWEFVLGSIERASGNIISTHTSERFSGHWGTMEFVVVFPLIPTEKDRKAKTVPNILRRLITCFKELQGEELGTDQYINFSKELDTQKGLIYNLLEGLRDKQGWVRNEKPRHQSTLKIKKNWDPIPMGPRWYSKGFEQNPFSFTRPISLTDLNSGKEKRYDRLEDAKLIHSNLELGVNIAIVGAHRVGKTSILNVVHDLDKRIKDNNKFSICLNGATTQPYWIMPELIKSMKERNSSISVKLLKSIQKIFKRYNPDLKDLKLKLGAIEATPNTNKISPLDFEGRLTQICQNLGEKERLEFLKDCLGVLKNLLEKNPEIKINVLIDEVGEFMDWGNERFFPIWRQVIESESFHQIRWLITTTKSIKESTSFSPITNVFREYNVGSLSVDDTVILMDSFDRHPDGSFCDAKPVLTFETRMFILKITSRLPYFLQVLLFHLYNHVTRYFSPIANRQVCRWVLKQKVLPEISDYISHAWQKIPTQEKDTIHNLLAGKERKLSEDIYRDNDYDYLHEESIPPKVNIALSRSGLKGEDKCLMAPIVLLWMFENDRLGIESN